MALAQPREHGVDSLHVPGFRGRALTLLRDNKVFPNSERRKDPASLRYQSDPEVRNTLWAESFDWLSIQSDFAVTRLQKADNRRDAGRLSGPVSSQQRQHTARSQ